MKIIIPVSNKYHYIMPVFCKMFNKYWKNQDCILLCHNKISLNIPDNFEVISMGVDTNGYWTPGLIKFFRSFKEEQFILHLEDHILTDYVKLDKYKIMENEIFNGADKAMLHSHLNIFSTPLHDDVLLIKQDADYRTSIHTSIWKTNYFLEKLKSGGNSVWSFEGQQAKNDGAKIVSIKSENTYHDHIVFFINLLRAGKIDPSMTGLWHEDDLDVLLEIPMDEENKSVLIRKTNNKCFSCGNHIDLMLINNRDRMLIYEKNGICAICQG